MATKTSNIEIELAHFRNFSKYLPKKIKNLCPQTLQVMLNMGMIQVSTAFEHALANVGKFQVISENGCDGSDGSDAKLVTVRHRNHETEYSAYVSNTSGKTGKLRVQVYERIQNKFYYFVIPNRLYSQVKYLEIPFDLSGDPKRKTRNGKNKWWKCEVQTFEELAQS